MCTPLFYVSVFYIRPPLSVLRWLQSLQSFVLVVDVDVFNDLVGALSHAPH